MNTGRKITSSHHAGVRPILLLAASLRGKWRRASRRQRIGLLISCLAVGMLLSLPLAGLLLSLNPYLPVIERVRGLLNAQPGFEEQLAALESFQTALPPIALLQTDPAPLPAADETTSPPTNPLPAPQPTEAPAQQPISAIRHSMIALQKTLEIPLDTPQLSLWLRQLQGGDALLSLQAIEGIYQRTPGVLRRLYDIRRANLAVMRQIHELTGEEWLNAAAPQPVSSSTASFAGAAPTDWIGLRRACQSVEIQLANTTYLLHQIYQEIEPVYRQDLLWGFSIWIKGAAWLWNHRTDLTLLSLGLLACSALLMAWRPLPNHLRPNRWLDSLDFSKKTSRLRLEGQPANRSFAAQSGWFIKGLSPSVPRRPLRISRRGRVQRPRLLIPVSGESPIEKPLPADGIVRIGNDPAFPVKIPLSGAEYIELWIRKARKGYFLEVMFSDRPVLVNQQTVQPARVLNDGDTIQIQDTVLIFRER